MDEKQIKKTNLKLFWFDEFPYEELREILDYFKNRGYKVEFVENRAVLTKGNV